MRAWQITRNGEPEAALQLADVPVPMPGPGELRVRVAAAGLGLPDVFLCRGSYAFRPELPATPGQEVCGVVSVAGEGTTTPVGSRVMAVTAFFRGHGGFAQEALVLDAAAYPAPDAMPATQASGFVIPYHTAWLGLVTRARLQPGEWLLVPGAAGGSGAAAVQLGRALGARVIAVVGGDAKAAHVRHLGAEIVIDHAREDVAARVGDATRGHGVDIVYDPVGGQTFEAAVPLLASEGRLLAVGHASGRFADASTRTLVDRNAAVLGVYVGRYAKPFLDEVHAALLEHFFRGEIASTVTREVDFEALPSALASLAARTSIGKTVTRPD